MAITANEKVLTLDFWKRASHVQAGDYVFDRNGKPVKVKFVQHFMSEHCYEVAFDDHLRISGDQNLELFLETPKYRNRLQTWKQIQRFRRPLSRFFLENLLDEPLADKRDRSRLSLPTTQPIQFPSQTLPIPPFLFGFWFFNRRANKKMAAPRNKAEFIHQKFRDYGYKVILGAKIGTGEQEFYTIPAIHSQLAPNIPRALPMNYLMASVEQRIELLSGIMCAKSRQYSPKNDTFRFSSRNFNEILQLQQLVESLGSRTLSEHDPSRSTYTLFFKSKLPLVDNQRSAPVKLHHARRYIAKIKPIQSQMCVHIETEGTNNTFLVGEGFIACR